MCFKSNGTPRSRLNEAVMGPPGLTWEQRRDILLPHPITRNSIKMVCRCWRPNDEFFIEMVQDLTHDRLRRLFDEKNENKYDETRASLETLIKGYARFDVKTVLKKSFREDSGLPDDYPAPETVDLTECEQAFAWIGDGINRLRRGDTTEDRHVLLFLCTYRGYAPSFGLPCLSDAEAAKRAGLNQGHFVRKYEPLFKSYYGVWVYPTLNSDTVSDIVLELWPEKDGQKAKEISCLVARLQELDRRRLGL